MNFAIHNDTLFLYRHKIVDYSLLLIIDNKNRLLRVGILDHLIQYTIDKSAEEKFKKFISGIHPTIIRPLFYKNRFREYMM